MWHVIFYQRSEQSTVVSVNKRAQAAKRPYFRRVLRNKSLMIGFSFLIVAFLISLFTVIPRTHLVLGEEIIPNTKSTTVRLNALSSLGKKYGGLWGNMTFISSSSSTITLKLEHVNGTECEKTLFLSSRVPGTISIHGLIPKEMDFVTEGGIHANLTYSYVLKYYSYPTSSFGILAAIISILGAIFGFRGLFYHIMGIASEETS